MCYVQVQAVQPTVFCFGVFYDFVFCFLLSFRYYLLFFIIYLRVHCGDRQYFSPITFKPLSQFIICLDIVTANIKK